VREMVAASRQCASIPSTGCASVVSERAVGAVPALARDDCGGASDAGAKGAQCFRRGSEQPFSSRNRMRSLPERK
jgi:hypothetical protein